MKQQKKRLMETWSEQDLVKVEEQFRSFKDHVPSPVGSQEIFPIFHELLINRRLIVEESLNTAV